MRPTTLLIAFALTTGALAGCLDGDANPDAAMSQLAEGTVQGLLDLAFAEKHIIDDVRAGGEPVIAITHDGTILVSSHPGGTHYHPSDDNAASLELITPLNGQSYLWRSTDGGDAWTHIGLPGMEQGPRSTGFGVSDPEFTVMEDGTICYTDLEGLAMSSVSCSTDDGQSWTGNPIASQRPNDRQWLASYGNELYFTANYFSDHNLIVSTDRGITWETRGNVPTGYDIIADPSDGTLVGGHREGLVVSNDGGRTWERRDADVRSVRRDMTEPAIDSAGITWMAWPVRGDNGTGEHIVVKGSPDHGKSWPHEIYLISPQDPVRGMLCDDGATCTPINEVPASNATWVGDMQTNTGSAHIWPWVSAGSEGRLAVSWIGAPERNARSTDITDWHLYTAILIDAHTDQAHVRLLDASDGPIHSAAICQSGTVCQVDSMQGNPQGDRRLGDFFESTIDAQGRLHIVVSDTVSSPNDVISHVAYMRLDSGISLVVDGDRMPTQG